MEEKKLDKLFVGGDMSGIQKFLYNVTSKKAAVSLIGRSEYLNRQLNETCINLLKEEAVNSSAYIDQIYCSGGKFYLIVDNTPEVVESIDNYSRSVEEQMWNEHFGQLFLYISYVPFAFNADDTIRTEEKESAPIGELWRLLANKFAILKNQKLKDLLSSEFENFFDVQKVGGSPQVCAITGIESDKLVTIEKDEYGDAVQVLPIVQKQIELGKKIREQRGFKTFAQYAQKSKLGVLRMDIDNLGASIQKCRTLDEYKKLSAILTKYFEENIWILQHNYKDSVNLIYAGGDDVFAVGHWNYVIEFAHDLANNFNKYIQNSGLTLNAKLTLSGGVAIVDDKFPISKAAQIAGDAEDASKHNNNGEKNAFTFLGNTISWHDYDYIYSFKKDFVTLCREHNMPKSILHKMMAYNDMRKNGRLEYIWNSMYFIARFNEYKNDEIKKFVKKLHNELIEDTNNYGYIALAARWAELEMK